jgi:uncharacterized protein YlxW (UPF0749 family)
MRALCSLLGVMDAEKRKLIEENRRLRATVEELERTVRSLQEQVQVLSAALETCGVPASGRRPRFARERSP